MTSPDYLTGLEEWPMETVRARRDEATEVETGLSYVRRIVQGRLDIVVAERERRQKGEAPVDASQLVDQLKDILSEHVRAPGLGRLPAMMFPGKLDSHLETRLEEVLPVADLSMLSELSDARLTECADGLTEFERDVSMQRRAVLDVIDRLQEEIVRRYRSGEATVDSLLP